MSLHNKIYVKLMVYPVISMNYVCGVRLLTFPPANTVRYKPS